VCCAAIAIAVQGMVAQTAKGDRYWVEFRDGQTHTGDNLRNFSDGQRGPRLDNLALLDGENPARQLRDTERKTEPLAAHLELVNGDLLAGKVIAAHLGVDGEPEHLLVSETLHSGQVRVRLDWVRRISAKRRPHRRYTPGLLETTDGRQLKARSLRWQADGVRALTDDGIVDVRYDRIADLHATPSSPWLAPLPGVSLLDVESSSVLRMTTVQGEAFTVPRTMLEELKTSTYERRGFFAVRRRRPSRYQTPQIATRPLWSLDTLLLEERHVASAVWLSADEIPLSLLPLAKVEEKSGVHHLPWRLQQNIFGESLHSGDAMAELGIGMHSFTRLAFTLPEHAQTFATRVGFDRAAHHGGCVHLRVWRDAPRGEPLWERKFFRGSDGVQEIGPIDIAGADQLILEVDFADEGRPQGADPLDIRDWINWLMPIVKIDPTQQPSDTTQLVQLIPELRDWSLPPEQLAGVKLRPYWFARGEHWTMAIDSEQPLVFSRELQPHLGNAWLTVRATRDDSNAPATVLRVRLAGETVASTVNADLGTHDRGRFSERHYVLLPNGNSPSTVEIIAEPHKSDEDDIRGLVISGIALAPAVRNLSSDQQPVAPDVPLATLTPLSAEHNDEPLELLHGKITNGEPLNILSWSFADGFGVPTNSEITYKLDSTWREFVAVLGLADGWNGAGPYQILLDGSLHWSSDRKFDRNEPGEQISVPIPPGHETITLRLLGDDSHGAWASAGFLSDAE
jgi:hypothetical protein